MREQTCDGCAYWGGIDDIVGTCRRYAPRPRPSDTFRWPVTAADDWCGEWEDGEGVCTCEDDEVCGICEPADDIDTAFAELVELLNDDTPRRLRRWWRRGR